MHFISGDNECKACALILCPSSCQRFQAFFLFTGTEAHNSTADSFIKQIKSLGESNSTSDSATLCSFVIVRCYEIGHGALDSLLLAVVTV